MKVLLSHPSLNKRFTVDQNKKGEWKHIHSPLYVSSSSEEAKKHLL